MFGLLISFFVDSQAPLATSHCCRHGEVEEAPATAQQTPGSSRRAFWILSSYVAPRVEESYFLQFMQVSFRRVVNTGNMGGGDSVFRRLLRSMHVLPILVILRNGSILRRKAVAGEASAPVNVYMAVVNNMLNLLEWIGGERYRCDCVF